MLKKLREKNRGQSTLEYILLVTAIIAIVVTFQTGVFKTRVNTTIDLATNGMVDMAKRLGATKYNQFAY